MNRSTAQLSRPHDSRVYLQRPFPAGVRPTSAPRGTERNRTTVYHNLKARGAAFSADGSTRLDTTGTGGAGHAMCSCGWISEELPSGKQRLAAHAAHKQQSLVAEDMSGLEPSSDRVTIQRTFTGNYAPQLPTFVRDLAAGYGGLEVGVEPGDKLRVFNAAITGEQETVSGFLVLLDRVLDEVFLCLREWTTANREARRTLHRNDKFRSERGFIAGYGREIGIRLAFNARGGRERDIDFPSDDYGVKMDLYSTKGILAGRDAAERFDLGELA